MCSSFSTKIFQNSQKITRGRDSCLYNFSLLKALHKKYSFPLRISPVNVTKSAGICGFGHIY